MNIHALYTYYYLRLIYMYFIHDKIINLLKCKNYEFWPHFLIASFISAKQKTFT